MILYGIFCILLLAALAILLAPLLRTHDLPLTQRRRFAVVVGGIFFSGLFGLYYILGAPGIVPLLAQREQKMVELKDEIIKQSDAVKANPHDLAAWAGLGQNFMVTGQFHAAANAFKQTVNLSKGNPLLILAYASAMISDADGTVTDEAKKSLEMVLLQQPENPEARYLLAVRSLQDGHNEEAMKAMKELYRSLPDGAPLKTMIDKQIGK
jgi:cytochrome c-type biogenesis protein CcmH